MDAHVRQPRRSCHMPMPMKPSSASHCSRSVKITSTAAVSAASAGMVAQRRQAGRQGQEAAKLHQGLLPESSAALRGRQAEKTASSAGGRGRMWRPRELQPLAGQAGSPAPPTNLPQARVPAGSSSSATGRSSSPSPRWAQRLRRTRGGPAAPCPCRSSEAVGAMSASGSACVARACLAVKHTMHRAMGGLCARGAQGSHPHPGRILVSCPPCLPQDDVAQAHVGGDQHGGPAAARRHKHLAAIFSESCTSGGRVEIQDCG